MYKFLNIVWAYTVYFAVNVILYRRDWSELRERRKPRFGGSGKTGTSLTDSFDVAKKEPVYIEPKKYALLKQEPVKPELLTGTKQHHTKGEFTKDEFNKE